jgi:hypothetical protein
MRLLLLVSIATTIGTAGVHARTPNLPNRHMNSIYSGDSLSVDSIQSLYQRIDTLSIFELKKWRESYIYKNRTEPSDQNKEILLYIEERMKTVR